MFVCACEYLCERIIFKNPEYDLLFSLHHNLICHDQSNMLFEMVIM